MAKTNQKTTSEQFAENDRLDMLEGWKKKATSGETIKFDLMVPEKKTDWLPIDDRSRFPGWEYIYLFDNGNQVIGKEQLPGRIYYATGIWEPLERFTHFMECPENPPVKKGKEEKDVSI